MKIVIRFRYGKPVNPNCEIVELTPNQWGEFFQLYDADKRRDYMLKLLGMEHLDVKELWWIPLDFQSKLEIYKGVKPLKPKTN